MVRCAVATVSNRILPSRATATPEWSACVLSESNASCSRAAEIVAGLEKRRLSSAKVWSAPSTSKPGRRRATASAFSRASRSAIFSGEAPACGASAARSSISAGSISTGMPAASSSVRRTLLFEASTSGAPRHRFTAQPPPRGGAPAGARPPPPPSPRSSAASRRSTASRGGCKAVWRRRSPRTPPGDPRRRSRAAAN